MSRKAMDRPQEEIKFLGFFGILKESCNIVSSRKKFFSQITLSLIIPLSFIYLAKIQITEHFPKDPNIMRNKFILNRTRSDSKNPDILSPERETFILFKLGYVILYVILLLLSISAVVYTIGCIYTAKEITFRKVMSAFPKVWKRLMTTLMWNFMIFVAYNFMSAFVFILGAPIVELLIPVLENFWLALFGVVYLVGLFYITIIWHLASVISVLEESYGLDATVKSQALIKGKKGVAVAVFSVVLLCFIVILLMFEFLVVLADGQGIGSRIGYGIICLVLQSISVLFELIIPTIMYFVCKSYHHESIDKSAFAGHLECYLGECAPLKSENVLLEQFEV